MPPSGGLLSFEELPFASSSSSYEPGMPIGRSCRTAWISDVHLGTRANNVGALLQFLRDYDCDKLYIVGDLIDIWQLRPGIFWPQHQNGAARVRRRRWLPISAFA